MSITNLAILAFKVFSLLILVDQVSSTDYSALLSRLYKRAAASDRPLIVLIDSNILQSDRQTYKTPNKILDGIGFNRLDYGGSPVSSLIQKKKRPRNKNVYKPQKSYDIEKKLHNALLPMQKRLFREREILRSPIIRNLLRISNNLKCQARNECEDQCNDKYTGPKNNNCVNTCDTKFTCEEEPEESGCDECETNSCGDDDNCQGSTKGYTVTDPSVGCSQC